MRLLLDQGVPRRAAALLREAGVDAVHTSETGLASADDRDVVAWCRANGAVVVTLDADFHALIALSGETTPSTVRIRIEHPVSSRLAAARATRGTYRHHGFGWNNAGRNGHYGSFAWTGQ